jgi:histone H3/H4
MADDLMTRMIDEALNYEDDHHQAEADSRSNSSTTTTTISSTLFGELTPAQSRPDEEEEEASGRRRRLLISAAAIRRALPRGLRISRAAVRALQAGLEAYAADTWAWASALARSEGRAGPRAGTLRLCARLLAERGRTR